MAVEAGKQISIEYTLTIDPEGVVDSNVDADPLTYIQGTEQIVPALQQALEGKNVGDTVDVSIDPKDGYGERSEEACQEVSKGQVPEEAHKVNTVLQGQDNQGGVVNARVAEVREETLLLDFNHPLAGKTLQFSVKILDIQDP
jgi:FKBP-type peptidyl-prolyl cis-trans isomerase SlyD